MTATQRTGRPVLFDTDIGSDVDDALALALILASPELRLVAVTTVAGDAALRARVAAALLGLAGRSEIEVSAGEDRPLLRDPKRFALAGHEAECIADARPAPVTDETGPERIVRAARECAGLELVMVGPMTNLARALAIDPELPERVGGITIMGGHIREVRIGDFVCPHGIDHNLCTDPEATVAVLGAGFRTTLVTADVTLSTWLEREELERLRVSGRVGRELARQVDLWEPRQRRLFTELGGQVDDDNVAYLHDPLAVLSLFDESRMQVEELSIVTTIRNGTLRTLEDPSCALGVPMRVVTAVDARPASRMIADRLIGFSAASG